MDILDNVKPLPQRQDSTIEQLVDLKQVACKLGMFDAADAIDQLFKTNKVKNIKYGCHCDLEPVMEPDGCVIDENEHHKCIYAKFGMRKEQCEYWKIIIPK